MIATALGQLSAASLPIGPLCVGAAREFSTARQRVGLVVSSAAVKFLLMPVAALLLAPSTTPARRSPSRSCFKSCPTASSAYIMARQPGSDAPLMAGITAPQTMVAAAIIPLVPSVLAGGVRA
ncbi:hypothetical protein [Aquabacter sediminis]|uniref:hypothetical protein n=1 Tax=Aquabacter sediminis TaxID=3029197 RepID=UPI00237E0485|nr:hypothetical protein [Aquabacter sp. P-9]MDE1568026.1 hypothetical protein [Aquabacter sp. P-9]